MPVVSQEGPADKALCSKFQHAVAEHLIRHRSVLDVLSKLQEANARVHRAVVKAITTCGCIQVNARKQRLPDDISLSEMKAYMDTHLKGSICESCRDALEAELGRSLFYTAALCELFRLDLDRVMRAELSRVLALGVFNLT